MKIRSLVTLLAIGAGAIANAADMISINFYAQPKEKGWGHNMEVISEKEKSGIKGHGLNTLTTTWNNLPPEGKGMTTVEDLRNDKGKSTGVSVNFRGAYSTWNGAHNNKPNKAGVPVWLEMNVKNAVALKEVHAFAKMYDLVVYLGTPENGSFVGGEVTVGDESQAVGPETTVLIFKDLRRNNLQIGLSNDTPKGAKNGVIVLGGVQIVAKD